MKRILLSLSLLAGAAQASFIYNGTGGGSGLCAGCWNLLGNGGTDAATNYLGTTDSVDLVFRTNATERLRLTASGSIDTTLGLGLVHSDASGVLTSSLLVNADVDAAAAIAGTKIDPDFGSQNVETTGTLDAGSTTVSALEIGTLTGVLKGATGVVSAGNVDLTTEVTGVLPLANGGTNKNMTAANGQVAYSDADSLELTTGGTTGYALTYNSGGAPTWVDPATFSTDVSLAGEDYLSIAGQVITALEIDLADNVSGILPLANGGTAKNLTAVAGGVVVSDADSMEITAAGTSGQVLTSQGASPPVWSDISSGFTANSDTTLTASDTLAIGTTVADRMQSWRVAGNSGPVTMSTTPFGSTDPQDRTLICVVGTVNTRPVTFPINDAANGIVGNGETTLAQYDSACFRYMATDDRYIIESRSP